MLCDLVVLFMLIIYDYEVDDRVYNFEYILYFNCLVFWKVYWVKD